MAGNGNLFEDMKGAAGNFFRRLKELRALQMDEALTPLNGTRIGSQPATRLALDRLAAGDPDSFKRTKNLFRRVGYGERPRDGQKHVRSDAFFPPAGFGEEASTRSMGTESFLGERDDASMHSMGGGPLVHERDGMHPGGWRFIDEQHSDGFSVGGKSFVSESGDDVGTHLSFVSGNSDVGTHSVGGKSFVSESGDDVGAHLPFVSEIDNVSTHSVSGESFVDNNELLGEKPVEVRDSYHDDGIVADTLARAFADGNPSAGENEVRKNARGGLSAGQKERVQNLALELKRDRRRGVDYTNENDGRIH
jgi:hypothetical protein